MAFLSESYLIKQKLGGSEADLKIDHSKIVKKWKIHAFPSFYDLKHLLLDLFAMNYIKKQTKIKVILN
jgi:hypothetical protein